MMTSFSYRKCVRGYELSYTNEYTEVVLDSGEIRKFDNRKILSSKSIRLKDSVFANLEANITNEYFLTNGYYNAGGEKWARAFKEEDRVIGSGYILKWIDRQLRGTGYKSSFQNVNLDGLSANDLLLRKEMKAPSDLQRMLIKAQILGKSEKEMCGWPGVRDRIEEKFRERGKLEISRETSTYWITSEGNIVHSMLISIGIPFTERGSRDVWEAIRKKLRYRRG